MRCLVRPRSSLGARAAPCGLRLVPGSEVDTRSAAALRPCLAASLRLVPGSEVDRPSAAHPGPGPCLFRCRTVCVDPGPLISTLPVAYWATLCFVPDADTATAPLALRVLSLRCTLTAPDARLTHGEARLTRAGPETGGRLSGVT